MHMSWIEWHGEEASKKTFKNIMKIVLKGLVIL
jgi:hypothetical protein